MPTRRHSATGRAAPCRHRGRRVSSRRRSRYVKTRAKLTDFILGVGDVASFRAIREEEWLGWDGNYTGPSLTEQLFMGSSVF
jgi:hypothetical protein